MSPYDLARIASQIAHTGAAVGVSDAEVLAAITRSSPEPDQTVEVQLTGWEKGLLSVSLVQTTHHFARIGLAASKHLVEELINGKPFTVRVARQDAELFKTLVVSKGARVAPEPA